MSSLKPLSKYIFFVFVFYKQILASILLLCQISTMTSYPVVDEGQQKPDVFYRDNANSGVIIEENALHSNSGSSDQRNVTLSSFLNLFPPHARVARDSHPCVTGKPRTGVPCGSSLITVVSCREASIGCIHKVGRCAEKTTACAVQGGFKIYVTGCECGH